MNKIYIITILAISMVFMSCDKDFLSPTPISSIGGAGYYQNAAEVESAVISVYDALQGRNSTSTNDNRGIQLEFYIAEMLSDNTKTKSSEGESADFETYNLESTNGIVTNYYQSMYDIIARANIVLGNLENAGGQQGQFEGEAKFLRALAYFNLVRSFGDVPLVDRTIDPLDTDVQFTRVAAAQVYDLIVSDLGTAVSNLENNSASKTRATKAAAQALLAKVHLTIGNHDLARGLCQDITGYSLEGNFKDVFFSEGNSEVIFAVGYKSDDVNDSQNFSAEWLNAVGRTTGVNYVTDEAAAALDALGGNRTTFSYRQDALQNEFNQVVKYVPNGDDNLGIAAVSSNPILAGNDWIVLRYADVLLMHVEAIMAGGVNTVDNAAVQSFQAVRNRAGLTATVNDVTSQMLLDERRVELAFENQRFFDLKRMGAAINVLTDYSANNGYSFSPTDLLLPLPQREINLSNGLMAQNPGYN